MKRRDFITAGGIAVASALFAPHLFATPKGKPLKILALVFDDYETLDLHGPVEMLGHMSHVQILLVGAKSIIRSYQGPKVVTDISMEQVTPCDLLIVPGGIGTRTLVEDSELLSWLQAQEKVSKKVFSICTGSALLAKAGILDGVNATTNKMAYQWVTSLSQRVHWQPSARWVDEGKFLTSSGVSAGTDAALFYVRQLRGEEEARRIERLTEYHWNDDSTNDPYAVEV
ncbi:DJ-1/PfpI family protein [Shewanella woodyi]|uniref:ThiJ/PfpI domain protein n=1 Tax=Shewanella woodyi (strain ATCC 51908 / MS32) TaxID=392500 RepID=B1KL62_SHEWM|nr:DJ-1/PfpI family protein [Shewanella woodyi]ACA84403.1 ThiJ/PfpI domain protein [Shewanella woodyi ATCC 51908]